MTHEQAKSMSSASLEFTRAVANVAGKPELLGDHHAASYWYFANIGEIADAFIANQRAGSTPDFDELEIVSISNDKFEDMPV